MIPIIHAVTIKLKSGITITHTKSIMKRCTNIQNYTMWYVKIVKVRLRQILKFLARKFTILKMVNAKIVAT